MADSNVTIAAPEKPISPSKTDSVADIASYLKNEQFNYFNNQYKFLYFLWSRTGGYESIIPTTWTLPLSVNGGTVSMSQATTATNGWLSSVDWNVFDKKEPAIAVGTSGQYWRGDKNWEILDTSVVPEGTNLYFTDARAAAAISSTVTGLTYTTATGVFSLTSGYIIPQTAQILPTGLYTGSLLAWNGTAWKETQAALNNGVAWDGSESIMCASSTTIYATISPSGLSVNDASIGVGSYGSGTLDLNGIYANTYFGLDYANNATSYLQCYSANGLSYNFYRNDNNAMLAFGLTGTTYGTNAPDSFLGITLDNCVICKGDDGDVMRLNAMLIGNSGPAPIVFGVNGNENARITGSGLMLQQGIIDNLMSTLSINPNARQLFDSTVVVSIDWNSRALCGPIGDTRLDWNYSYTFDDTGWISMDWNTRKLYDNNGGTSIDWLNRQLFDSAQNIIMDYSNTTSAILLTNVNGDIDINTGTDLTISGAIRLTANASPTGFAVLTVAGNDINMVDDAGNSFHMGSAQNGFYSCATDYVVTSENAVRFISSNPVVIPGYSSGIDSISFNGDEGSIALTPIATAPASPTEGTMYVDNTAGNHLKIYLNSAWHTII